MTIKTIVSLESSSMRLDKYVVTADIQNISRSRIKNGIKKALLNGKESKLSAKVKNGDEIILEWEEIIPSDIKSENIPLDILYDDDNVTVVNKKQGMVTHPACGNWHGTLANALLYFWENQNSSYKKDTMSCNTRPGIVHRLDKDTTGTLIAAKNPETETYLQEQFKSHRIKKEYIAIVNGIPPKKHGSIKTNIIRDPRNRKKFIVTEDKSKGKTAKTIYTCIACYGPYSLMRIRLKTGRTHQIRVHLKSIGCTITGDPIYGKPDKNLTGATLMLHARLLSLRLPGQETFMEFKSPVPVRFKKVLKYLHEHYPKRIMSEEDI